ncbi:MAG: SH3 domain-containing protein [Caldilineaceae bacterium]|nr:SH3 domain-containing protein [Caldilineaceae bacterium]
MRDSRLVIVTLTLFAMLALAACQPIQAPGGTIAEAPATEAPTEEGMTEALPDDGSAVATIATRSLRVRETPSEDAEVVYGVNEGETYRVVEISEDGVWVRLAIADAPDGGGWVAAHLVTVEGELTGMADDAMTDDAMTDDTVADDTVATAEPVEELAPPAAGFVQILTDGTRLRVRAEPNTDAEIVGYVYNGEEYELLGQSDDGTWVQIAGSDAAETDNPDGGWVATEFVIIGQ